LVPTVTNALRAAGLAASRLELEITESLPLQGDQDTLTTLRELHALGARITLDDFGTGYSQLFYLLNFPCSTIKIDRSFVRDIQSREDSAKIIRGIIGLAANLEIHVTAEGVETEAQYALLVTAGCDEIQGFLISRPVPAAEVPALIARLSAPAAADGHALAATV
jgi:EAL domain-containing protein (putative c-di-GMP-specific phosphodiesterase class I)